MNGREIVVTEEMILGRIERVRITFPPGNLADGSPEGCYLGMSKNALSMTREHWEALKEYLEAEKGVDELLDVDHLPELPG